MLIGCGPSQRGGESTTPARAAPSAASAPSSSGPRCAAAVARVSPPGRGAQHPQIAGGADAFAAVWEETSASRSVWLQTFAPDGRALGERVALGDGAQPRVAADGDGFAAFWTSEQGAAGSLAMRRFDRTGKPRGDAVPIVTAPGARALAVANVGGAFALAWWNWSGMPHQVTVTWIDGERTHDVAITRAPSADPTVDVAAGAAVGSKATAMVAWEELVDTREHVVVGELSRERLEGRVDVGVGETPELGWGVVVFERAGEQRIYSASFGGTTLPIADGHTPAAAPRDRSVSSLCFLRDTDPSAEVQYDELWCGTLPLGPMPNDVTRVAVAPRGVLALQLAVAADRSGVVWQSQEADDSAVSMASLTCPKIGVAQPRR